MAERTSSKRQTRGVRVLCSLAILVLPLGCSGSLPSGHKPALKSYREFGQASFYAAKYQGRKTASGERFDQSAMTAAHRSLPFGTTVTVTNIKNGKSVRVRINDRGPFVRGRIIDLTRSAFARIGDLRSGVIDVKIERVPQGD
ncbi:MAG: septal ring lytic transglycosylase RlpA family protein [Deltaproteobacteria bacterium]|nr:septal ring lytic transglycosylase RlpA family protein [Deltaproteobacteria bacterium]